MPGGEQPVGCVLHGVGGEHLKSLVGRLGPLSGISILLDVSPGGTYIVDATATYTVNGKQQSTDAQVCGGRATMMNAIPVGATSLTLDLAFKGMFSDEKHRFNGQIFIDLYGVWPGASRAVERTTGAVG